MHTRSMGRLANELRPVCLKRYMFDFLLKICPVIQNWRELVPDDFEFVLNKAWPTVNFSIHLPFRNVTSESLTRILETFSRLPYYFKRDLDANLIFIKQILCCNLQHLSLVRHFLMIEFLPLDIFSASDLRIILCSMSKIYDDRSLCDDSTILPLLNFDPCTIAEVGNYFKLYDLNLRVLRYIGDNKVPVKRFDCENIYLEDMGGVLSRLYSSLVDMLGHKNPITHQAAEYLFRLLRSNRQALDINLRNSYSMQRALIHSFNPGLLFHCKEFFDLLGSHRRNAAQIVNCFSCDQPGFSTGADYKMNGLIMLPCCSNAIHDDLICIKIFLRRQQCPYCEIKYKGCDPCFLEETSRTKSLRIWYRDLSILPDMFTTPLPSLKSRFWSPVWNIQAGPKQRSQIPRYQRFPKVVFHSLEPVPYILPHF